MQPEGTEAKLLWGLEGLESGRLGAGWLPPQGDSPPPLQALSNQQKAVLMSERVMGIEHPNTIQEYVSGCWGGGCTAG